MRQVRWQEQAGARHKRREEEEVQRKREARGEEEVRRLKRSGVGEVAVTRTATATAASRYLPVCLSIQINLPNHCLENRIRCVEIK